MNAQSWTAPTISGEAPVSGETYKLYNVGGAQFLDEGQAWFSWSTTAILTDNGSDFTFNGDGSSFTLTTHRSGNSKVFTSGNEIPGDAIHLDGANATNYAYELLPSGNYQIHDSEVAEVTTCWGYEFIVKTGGQAQRDSWGVVAHSDASSIGNNGEWMFVGETSFNLYDAQFKLYNLLNQAQKEGVNTSEAATVYNNTSATIDELNVAYEALEQAIYNHRIVNASEENPADITDFKIVNPNFEINGLNGWTNNGMQPQNNTSFDKVGSVYCEAWQPNGIKSVSQTITGLPIGLYKLSVKSKARGVTSAKLYAGKYETGIEISDDSKTYEVEFACSGEITIGFEGEGTGAGNSWLCVDNFKLFFVKSLTEDEMIDYELGAIKGVYEAALAAAQDFDLNTIPTAAKNALQGVIVDNTGTYSTEEAYTAAITALNEAVANAELFVAPYKRYLDKADAVKNMKDADTYTGSDAKSTLESILSETDNNVEEATTVEAIDEETAKLAPAASEFVSNIIVDPNAGLDITCLIENPHFYVGTTNNPTGWTIEYPTDGDPGGWHASELRSKTHNFEAFHKQFKLSQTIKDLPVGTYKVTLQGFARHDDANVTDKTNLFCGIVNQPFKPITAEYSTTSYYYDGITPLGDTNYDASYQLNGETVYQPNGMSGFYYWSQEVNPMTEQPFYTNEVQTLLTEDGDLEIGFKCETWNDWVIWDNFHLFYYGAAISVTLDEAVGTSFTEDVQNANVTMFRSIKDGFNTVVLPFDATADQVAEAYGPWTEVYYFSENSEDPTAAVVNFTKGDGSIPANTPVLIGGADESDIQEFENVDIVAAESAVVEGTNYDFVGTFTPIPVIATSNYFIGEGFLWRSNGGTSLNAFRAFIQPKSAEARIAKFYIDGVETTGIEGVAAAVSANNNNKIYNLAGQQVKKAQKGLYIQNGKKVVVK